jgi:hypothetical protein
LWASGSTLTSIWERNLLLLLYQILFSLGLLLFRRNMWSQLQTLVQVTHETCLKSSNLVTGRSARNRRLLLGLNRISWRRLGGSRRDARFWLFWDRWSGLGSLGNRRTVLGCFPGRSFRDNRLALLLWFFLGLFPKFFLRLFFRPVFRLNLGLRRINGGLIKLALRNIFPDISARESLADRRPLVVVEEGIWFLWFVPDRLIMALGRLNIYRTVRFLLCEFFLSLSKEMSRGLGTIHGRWSSSGFLLWLCLLYLACLVWGRNLHGIVHALWCILPDILAGEIVPGLVTRCWLLGVLVAVFREKWLIFLDIIQRSGSKLLRIVVLVDAGRSALGSIGSAQRAAKGLVKVAAISTIMNRLDSGSLAVRMVIVLNLILSQNGRSVLVLLIHNSIAVTIWPILRVLGIINVHCMFTLGTDNLRFEWNRLNLAFTGRGRAGWKTGGVLFGGLETNLVCGCRLVARCVQARATRSCISDQLVQVILAHSKVILTIMQWGLVLPLQDLRVLFIVFLVELILGGNAMAVKAVATWGSTTRAVLAVVVLLELLWTRARRGSLDIAQMGVHGHTLADFRDTMVILNLLAAIANRNVGAWLLCGLGRSGATNAELCCLIGIGAGDSLDTLLGALSWEGRLGSMELEVLSDSTCLFRWRSFLLFWGLNLFGLDLMGHGTVLSTLLANGRHGDAGRALDWLLLSITGVESGRNRALFRDALIEWRGSETSRVGRYRAVRSFRRTRRDLGDVGHGLVVVLALSRTRRDGGRLLHGGGGHFWCLEARGRARKKYCRNKIREVVWQLAFKTMDGCVMGPIATDNGSGLSD